MNPKKTVNDREIDDLKGSVQERVPAAALVSIQGRCHFTVHLADGYLGLTGALSQKKYLEKIRISIFAGRLRDFPFGDFPTATVTKSSTTTAWRQLNGDRPTRYCGSSSHPQGRIAVSRWFRGRGSSTLNIEFHTKSELNGSVWVALGTVSDPLPIQRSCETFGRRLYGIDHFNSTGAKV